MDNTTYFQRNREIMPNRAKDYYENDKARLREQARNKYRNLSEENKIKKKENMEKRDIITCLKKRNKNEKNIKNEDIEKQKSLRITNKIVYLLLNLYI